jgi:hypothetical protein
MKFGASPPHEITWIRGGPPCNKAAHSTGHRRLSDLKFTPDLTYQQVTAIWGRPDSFGGSGIDYFLYQLREDNVVWLEFEPDAPYRLLGGYIRNPKTRQNEGLPMQYSGR